MLRRAGHTEAAVDLARAAGLYPAGILAEVVNDDGTMARRPQLERFAKNHDLTIMNIDDLIRFRRRHYDGIQHTALVKGNVAGAANVLVRVHSECLTGDLFGSMRCDCGRQLDGALSRIAAEGRGVVVYLRGHEGRGIGIGHKVRAYQLQDQGRDTLQANLELGLPGDGRDYSVGAQIVADLGITSMRPMTNNPAKYEGIAELGLTISDAVDH